LISRSLTYWLATSLAGVLARWFQHSLIGRFCAAVRRTFNKYWQESGLRHILLGNFGVQKNFDKSLCGKVLHGFSNAATRCASRIEPHVDKSLFLSASRGFFSNLPHISLRSYGVLLFLTGVIPSAASFALHGYFPLLMAVVAVAGLPLMLINRSFAGMFNGSWLAKKAGRFFYLGELDEDDVRHYLPLFALLGAAFGTAAHVLDLTTFVFLIGGLVGGLLVLYKTEIGVFATAFLLPLMPTMLILGLVAATALSFFIKVFVTGKIRLRFAAIDMFVLIFALIVALSTAFSFNIASSLPVAAVYLIFIVFYFVVKNTINTRQKFFAVLSIIAVSGLLVAAFGVWQRLTGNFVMTEAWLDAQFFGYGAGRIYSTLENPNVFGKYLIFILVIAFGMIYYFREYLHKFAAIGILGVAALSIIFTQSRGAWLGLIFAMGVFALLRDRRLVILGLIALIIAPFFIPPEVMTRFLSIGDLADTSTSFRVSIWLGSLDMIRVFWPIGIGLGAENFTMIYNLYAFSAAHALHSHNLFLQLIIDFGVSGLAVFFLIMTSFFKSTFVSATAGLDRAMQAAAAVLGAAMLGFLIQGLTDNVWFNYRVLGFFWLIVALGAASRSLILQNIDIEEDKDDKTNEQATF